MINIYSFFFFKVIASNEQTQDTSFATSAKPFH